MDVRQDIADQAVALWRWLWDRGLLADKRADGMIGITENGARAVLYGGLWYGGPGRTLTRSQRYHVAPDFTAPATIGVIFGLLAKETAAATVAEWAALGVADRYGIGWLGILLSRDLVAGKEAIGGR